MNLQALIEGAEAHPGMRLRQAIAHASLQALLAADSCLPDAAPGLLDVATCNQLLHQNLAGSTLAKG